MIETIIGVSVAVAGYQFAKKFANQHMSKTIVVKPGYMGLVIQNGTACGDPRMPGKHKIPGSATWESYSMTPFDGKIGEFTLIIGLITRLKVTASCKIERCMDRQGLWNYHNFRHIQRRGIPEEGAKQYVWRTAAEKISSMTPAQVWNAAERLRVERETWDDTHQIIYDWYGIRLEQVTLEMEPKMVPLHELLGNQLGVDEWFTANGITDPAARADALKTAQNQQKGGDASKKGSK